MSESLHLLALLSLMLAERRQHSHAAMPPGWPAAVEQVSLTDARRVGAAPSMSPPGRTG